MHLLNLRIILRIMNRLTDLSKVKDDDGKQIDVLAKISVEFISRNPYQPRFNIDPVSLRRIKKINTYKWIDSTNNR